MTSSVSARRSSVSISLLALSLAACGGDVAPLRIDEAARGGLFNPWPTGPSWTTVQPRLVADGTILSTILDDDYGTFPTGSPLEQYRRMATDLGQPASDVYVEAATVPGIGPSCDAIVARARGLSGL